MKFGAVYKGVRRRLFETVSIFQKNNIFVKKMKFGAVYKGYQRSLQGGSAQFTWCGLNFSKKIIFFFKKVKFGAI